MEALIKPIKHILNDFNEAQRRIMVLTVVENHRWKLWRTMEFCDGWC